MDDTEKSFISDVRNAIDAHDPSAISDAVSNFSSFCFKETPPQEESPPFSDDFVQHLVELVHDEVYLKMEDSFKLIVLFQNDWGRLVQDQKESVCATLVDIFEDIVDNTSHLVIAELLGEYLSNSWSLGALQRVSTSKDEVARAHVAHGFGCLARQTQDIKLKDAAISRLKSMNKDASQIVRDEAAGSLGNIG
jgi:hypothetical protein